MLQSVLQEKLRVGCEKNAWSFGAKALYFKPTYEVDTTLQHVVYSESVTNRFIEYALAYGIGFGGGGGGGGTGSAPAVTKNFQEFSHKWGFQIFAAYNFGTGKNFNVNWFSYQNKATLFTNGTDLGYRTTSDVKTNWDAVNFELGQTATYGQRTSYRFFGGFQYSRIQTRYNNTFDLVPPDPTMPATSNEMVDIKFTGFGPRVGADIDHDLFKGVHVYANSGLGLLLGQKKTSTNTPALSVPGGATLPGILSSVSGVTSSRIAMVPEVDLKVGANYGFEAFKGQMVAGIGYMWVNYFHAQDYFVDALSATTGNSRKSSRDFGLSGLYFGLTWRGDAA